MANKVSNGLYFLVKDGNLNDLLTPAGSQVKVSSPGAITTIKSRLCTSDSYVWKIENIIQQSGKTDTFSITAEDSTALSFDEQTTDVYLDELDVENDRQLWEIHSVGSHRFGASIVRNARIRNKFDPSVFLDIGPSNEAVGKQPTPTAARAWRFVSLAPSDGVVNAGEDPSDLKENRDWLRDMLYYFSNRFGRASDGIGLYPYEKSHINYPNTGLRASGGRHF